MNQKIDVKWNLIERIQCNAEDWENNKGKELGMNYDYDCVKSFAETEHFIGFCTKNGLDFQLLINFCETFASHLNVPKVKWDKYHEPFKEESAISTKKVQVHTIDFISLVTLYEDPPFPAKIREHSFVTNVVSKSERRENIPE